MRQLLHDTVRELPRVAAHTSPALAGMASAADECGGAEGRPPRKGGVGGKWP